MEVSQYVQEGESVRQRKEARLDNVWDDTRPGEIVCTDTRLLYVGNGQVRDLDLDSIVEMVVKEPTYLNGYMLSGLFTFAIGLLLHFGDLPLEAIQDVLPLLIGLCYLVGVVGVILGIYYAKWTLVVETEVSEYVFRSNDQSLVWVAHSVRGE